MCIAIVTKPGATVSEEILQRCFFNNPDGAGLAFIGEGDKVQIMKGFMTAEDFIKNYTQLVNAGANKKAMLLHCRIATMGRVTADNTHPFKINKGALIHNGMLFSGSSTEDKSDTRIFAECMGGIFSEKFVHRNRKELDDFLGYNKVACLYDGGGYEILNEAKGSWEKDVWFSNSAYRHTYHSEWRGARVHRRNISGDV